jgi:hypothetical protein
MKLTAGVNFLNVLRAAFDLLRAKKTDKLTVFFTLLGSEHVKEKKDIIFLP